MSLLVFNVYVNLGYGSLRIVISIWRTFSIYAISLFYLET
jgi:hypothetical protein